MKAGINKLSIIYFSVGICEVLAECFSIDEAVVVLKPLIPVVLIFVYWQTSLKRSTLFFITMFFSVMTNALFVPTISNLFYAVVAFTIHRLFFVFYVVKVLKIKDFIPLAIGFVPFFFLFSYTFKFAGEVPLIMYIMIILQNTLVSLLGGISLSNYIMQDDSKNSWLYMCGLLFVLLQFVVFIERYYIMISIFRPIAMMLNICGFYCFYRFIISVENLHGNSPAGS